MRTALAGLLLIGACKSSVPAKTDPQATPTSDKKPAVVLPAATDPASQRGDAIIAKTPEARRYLELTASAVDAIRPHARKPLTPRCTDADCFDCAAAGRAWQAWIDAHGSEVKKLTPEIDRWADSLSVEASHDVNYRLADFTQILIDLSSACFESPEVQSASTQWSSVFESR